MNRVFTFWVVLIFLFFLLWIFRSELNAIASVCRATICLKKRQLPEATTYFRSAIAQLGAETHVFTVPILTWLASTYIKQGKLEEAETALRQGLRLARSTPAWNSFGGIPASLREANLL